jgi:hypothetical protein
MSKFFTFNNTKSPSKMLNSPFRINL